MKKRLLKNYFLEIWLILVVTTALTISLLSVVITNIFEQNSIEIINAFNRESIMQTSRVNEYIRRNIKISGMELFFEPSIRRLMYQEELSNFDIITGLRRLDSVQSMGSHIHSIYIFNGSNRYVYATSNYRSAPISDFPDTDLKDLLFSSEETMRLVPIARRIQDRGKSQPVYSFIYYDPMPDRSPEAGALIINLNLLWLEEIVGISDDTISTVLFIDRHGRVMYHSDLAFFLQDFSGTSYVETILSSRETNGHFIDKSESGRNFIMYTSSDEGDLFLIRIIPYTAAIGRIRELRWTILRFVFLFLLLGITVAFFYSRWIYKPIKILAASFKASDRRPDQNEMEYLSSSIESMLDEHTSLEAVSGAYLTALQTEVLKEILLGNVSESANSFQSLFEEYKIGFDPGGLFRLVLVEENSTRTLLHEFPAKRGDPVFSVRLTIREYSVTILQGNSLALLKWPESIMGYAIVSDLFRGAERLAFAYALCLEHHQIGTLYSKKGICFLDMQRDGFGSFEYPADLEKLILQSLRSGSSDEAQERYLDFVDAISLYRYENIKFSVRRLLVSIRFLIRELQTHGLFIGYDSNAGSDFDDRFGKITGIEGFRAFFVREFDMFEKEIRQQKELKHRNLADQIVNIVKEDFRNPNLSVTSIADEIGFSSSYISRIFKEATTCSLSDYINDIRIEAAKVLLGEGELSARDIAARVGFSNANYFYTLFRKKTGLTPMVYRTRL